MQPHQALSVVALLLLGTAMGGEQGLLEQAEDLKLGGRRQLQAVSTGSMRVVQYVGSPDESECPMHLSTPDRCYGGVGNIQGFSIDGSKLHLAYLGDDDPDCKAATLDLVTSGT